MCLHNNNSITRQVHFSEPVNGKAERKQKTAWLRKGSTGVKNSRVKSELKSEMKALIQ